MEKIEKQCNPKVMNLLQSKVRVKRFSFNKLTPRLLEGERRVDRTTMGVFIKYNNRGKEKIYIQRKII